MSDIEIGEGNFADFMQEAGVENDELLNRHIVNVEKMHEGKTMKDSKRFKAIVDFKARVLDMISIYSKEQGSHMSGEHKLLIIKGLLDALVVSF